MTAARGLAAILAADIFGYSAACAVRFAPLALPADTHIIVCAGEDGEPSEGRERHVNVPGPDFL
jgi:hypothetical protein